MSKNEELVKFKPLPLDLTQKEVNAYKTWQTANKQSIPASVNAGLFALFLQGSTVEEIQDLNPMYSLGEIVAARVHGDWDERREEHLSKLLDKVGKRVLQVTLESADFMADVIAVAALEHGEKLKRYIQTKNPAELGSFRVKNLKELKEAVEVLQKLTGQDKQSVSISKVQGEVKHTVETTPAGPTEENAAKAMAVLAGLLTNSNKDDDTGK